jgi:glycosyltransferase involved in cell wall biosynthesis
MSAPRVLFMTGGSDGSSLWRVWQPCAELERQGFVCHWVSKDEETERLLAAVVRYRYDAVVLSRTTWPGWATDLARRFVDMLHRHGLAVWFECDDDLFLHVEEHLIDDPEKLRQAKDAIHTVMLCDGIIVSTARLKTVVRHATGGEIPVAVCPNLLDYDWWKLIQRQARRIVPPVTIGWAGARRQDADLAPMVAGWRQVAEKHPAVRFVVQGHCPPLVTDAIPAARLTVLPWIELARYPAGLVNVDIGCCSVADTPFNACKSVIKALEYGASGAAVVATSALYRQIIRHHDTGLIADTADEWAAGLGRLVADAQYRAVLARRLRRVVVEKHNLQTGAHRWVAAFAWLLEQGRRQAA